MGAVETSEFRPMQEARLLAARRVEDVDADPEDAERELRQGVLLVIDDEHAQRICHRWRFQRTGRSAYRPVRSGS
jgi:hypothetical protein